MLKQMSQLASESLTISLSIPTIDLRRAVLGLIENDPAHIVIHANKLHSHLINCPP